MMRLVARKIHFLWIVVILNATLFSAETTTCEMFVDLSDIDRHIAHATISIPVKKGELSLWYPKWLPGCHAPAGPIQNLAHFQVTTNLGETLRWERRTAEPYEFLLDIPEGVESIKIELQYIVNQATTNSEGSDCAFAGNVGYFSFNTVVFYPTSSQNPYAKGNDLLYDVALKLPAGLTAQSALPKEATTNDTIEYAPVPLHQLVDCPLILGEHIKTIQLTDEDSSFKPHYLHVAAADAEQTELPDEFVEGLRNLVAEAFAVFGHAPFAEYHFLVIIDDTLADIGLEHASSSLNTMSVDEMEDEGLRADWPAELFPHEYVHAWCGKYRIPRAMAQLDFHSDKDFKLLWVYEGLTEYYGTVLAVRSGLVTQEQFLEHKAQRIHELSLQSGRNWRSLEDTAITSHLLRDFADYWQYKRRDQDYYYEGALYWWEVDALIRKESEGKASLDTFCAKFFGDQVPEDGTKQEFVPYREIDVYRNLNQVHPFDWESFFERRIKSTRKSLNMRAISRSGYRLKYGPDPSSYQLRSESRYGYIDESACLGLFITADGVVSDLVPNSPADRARLAEGDTITKFDGQEYDDVAFRNWLNASIAGSKLRLTVDRAGKKFDLELTIENPQARYPYLEKGEDRDWIQEILSPKALLAVP